MSWCRKRFLKNLEIILNTDHIKLHSKLRSSTIKLICAYCHNIFEKQPCEVRSSKKKGQIDFYCNRSCMAKHFGRGRAKITKVI